MIHKMSPLRNCVNMIRLFIVAGVLALRYAVNAERKPLEEVAPPLGSEMDEVRASRR